jgi:hypothetical protein
MSRLQPGEANAHDHGAVGTFEAIAASFHRAWQAGDRLERFYAIGGEPVRLRFARSDLLRLLAPALAHLETASCEAPALGVGIWDAASTGGIVPSLPDWWWDDCTGKGGVHVCHAERIHSAAHAWTLTLLDAPANAGLFWIEDPGRLTCSEIGAPLLRLFHWWVRGRGALVVHGGALGTPEGGVVLAGKGGTGKSTACLSALGSGLLYAGDDYCLLRPHPAPYVHSLYCSGKIDAQDAGRFPFLARALANRRRLPAEKALFLLQDHFPRQLATGFPLRAVLVPRVTDRRTTAIVPMAASAALLALAPSTIFQLPDTGAPELRALGAIVRAVPCYRLDAGTDLAGIPQAIAGLLAGL